MNSSSEKYFSRSCLSSFFKNVNRRKVLNAEEILATPLKRCLNLFDLIFLGIGHMVGAGIFVVTGTIARHIAGPSIVASFFLAGIAAALSSLCYAEFGSRVPRAGSAYVYSYVAIGELVAFLVGWSMILENLIASASVAKAWSGSLNMVCNGAIGNFTIDHIGHFTASWLGAYPDFIAFFIVLIWSIFVACDVKLSTVFNNLFTSINIAVLILFMCVAFYNADRNNWLNNGGFFPFGIDGTIAGAGICFYAFVGFEAITAAGEEASNPEKQVPIALIVSVLIVAVLYTTASMAITLFVPYYHIDLLAPFPSSLNEHGFYILGYIVGIGSLIGISSSLIGGLYMLPRAVYAMSADGLFFKCFAYIHPKTQTPIIATIVFGGITAMMALFFNLELLVDLLSIGTLLCFTIVAICVLILRYETVDQCRFQLKPCISKTSLMEGNDEKDISSSKQNLKPSQSHEDIGKVKKSFNVCQFFDMLPRGKAGIIGSMMVVFFSIILWLVIIEARKEIVSGSWWAILLLVISGLGLTLSVIFFCIHENNQSFLTFQIPWMPLIPVASIIVNTGLMLMLNKYTWLRLLIWIAIGLIIYFSYGIRNVPESQNLLNKSEKCVTYTNLVDAETKSQSDEISNN